MSVLHPWITFLDDTSIHGLGFSIHRWHFHPWKIVIVIHHILLTKITNFSQKLPKNSVKHGQNLTDYNSNHGWVNLIHWWKCHPWIIQGWHPWKKMKDDGHGRSQYVLAYIFDFSEFQFFLHKPQWCRCKWLCTTIWHTHAILKILSTIFVEECQK